MTKYLTIAILGFALPALALVSTLSLTKQDLDENDTVVGAGQDQHARRSTAALVLQLQMKALKCKLPIVVPSKSEVAGEFGYEVTSENCMVLKRQTPCPAGYVGRYMAANPNAKDTILAYKTYKVCLADGGSQNQTETQGGSL